MPIIIPQDLPAADVLERENIFVMTEHRAVHQDIRPLNIAIVNLMPDKITTETQLLRMLSNYPLQIDVDLVFTESYPCSHTPVEHLRSFYKSFSQIKKKKYDGMIITGAPVEKLRFGDVFYWEELKEIMDYSRENVTSTFHICWAAQAALYHHYGIHNYLLPRKLFGVFPHRVNKPTCELLRGFDDTFYVPHSRHTEIRREEVEEIKDLEILAESEEAGIYLLATRDGGQIFANGHPDSDADTLRKEYLRDIEKDQEIDVPRNYFPGNNPDVDPLVRWKAHGNLLFSNWLNYYVYQVTPYDLYAQGERFFDAD